MLSAPSPDTLQLWKGATKVGGCPVLTLHNPLPCVAGADGYGRATDGVQQTAALSTRALLLVYS